MTILMVRVVPQGIVFGADRNVTEHREYLGSGKEIKVINGQSKRPKVLRWPNNKALIGYAGEATIGGLVADEWLYDFIGRNIDFPNFESLANNLCTEVEVARKRDEGNTGPYPLLIHLAGFEKQDSIIVPVVRFIRNANTLKNDQYLDVKKEFTCSNELEDWMDSKNIQKADYLTVLDQLASKMQPFGFQQGAELSTFNILDGVLRLAINVIEQVHPDQPIPQTLEDWGKYVKMAILTFGAFFETYNEPGNQIVGGGADIVSLPWPG